MNSTDGAGRAFDHRFWRIILLTAAAAAVAVGIFCMFGSARLRTLTASYDAKLSAADPYGGYAAMIDRLGSLQDENDRLTQLKGEKSAAYDAAVLNAELAQARYDSISEKVGRPDSVNTTAELQQLTEKYEQLSAQTDALSIRYMDAVASQPQDGKVAYLTFDDGVSSNTLRILDILDRYGIKATFFPNWHSGRDELYRAIVDRGHAIGNHTSTHEWSSVYSTPQTFSEEVSSLSQNIYEITGVYPKIFRFPGGSNNTKYRANAAEEWKDTDEETFRLIRQDISWLYINGYMYFDWNVDSGDASGHGVPAQTIIDNVLSGAAGKQRAIILMHDTAAKDTTVDALPAIIEGLKAQGFEFGVLTAESGSSQFIKPRLD